MTLTADASLMEWLTHLESIHPVGIDMGLDRVQAVYQRLNLDWSGVTVITVAGTNGKGTTCAFIEAAAIQCGYEVGVYSS
ncbi:MAG: bifunctional tetrahydrofolate synthase/dihydrofolate synthase, partial [Glaciecola sp.]